MASFPPSHRMGLQPPRQLPQPRRQSLFRGWPFRDAPMGGSTNHAPARQGQGPDLPERTAEQPRHHLASGASHTSVDSGSREVGSSRSRRVTALLAVFRTGPGGRRACPLHAGILEAAAFPPASPRIGSSAVPRRVAGGPRSMKITRRPQSFGDST